MAERGRPSNEVGEWLEESVIEDVLQSCVDRGYRPGQGRILKIVQRVINEYLEEWSGYYLDGNRETLEEVFGGPDEIQIEVELQTLGNLYANRPEGMHQEITDEIIAEMQQENTERDKDFVPPFDDEEW